MHRARAAGSRVTPDTPLMSFTPCSGSSSVLLRFDNHGGTSQLFRVLLLTPFQCEIDLGNHSPEHKRPRGCRYVLPRAAPRRRSRVRLRKSVCAAQNRIGLGAVSIEGGNGPQLHSALIIPKDPLGQALLCLGLRRTGRGGPLLGGGSAPEFGENSRKWIGQLAFQG
jgi:hypothetical protein